MGFGFCDEFINYIITDEELNDGPNYTLIHFILYTYQGICESMVYLKMDHIYANYVKKMVT